MKLIIDIPEDSYKATRNGCMLPPDVENVVHGIKNGIPLPEGAEIPTKDAHSDLCTRVADVPDTNVGDLISRKAAIDAFHFWFRDGFDEDKWWNSTHVLAAIEGLPSVHPEHKWETCFECTLSHGCPKIKGCTNEQAIKYASQIPNGCPLYAQTENRTETHACDCISRDAAIDAITHELSCGAVVDQCGLETAYDLIKELPPVEPERKSRPCDDAISRREAIKKFIYSYNGERIPDCDLDNFPTQIDIKTVKEILRGLPSVTPADKAESEDKVWL